MIRNLSAIAAIAFVVAACDQPPQAASPIKYWLVFFDLNSAELLPRGEDTVREAASAAKSIPGSRVTVTGNTDTGGRPAHNMALSLKRANAVRDALVREGVSPASITVSGRGAESLLVVTPDQVKLESNRRVEIVVQ